MNSAAENRTCPSCGAAIPANALQGICPKCLMAAAAVATDAGPTGGKRPEPPSLERLATAFPQLEVIEFIGQGGMGAVYKARQKQLDRVVALKVLPPGIGGDAAFAERFTREAKALAKLLHPNIVALFEFGQADGIYYLLMEYVDGVSLGQLLRSSRVSSREALAIVPQICDALQYAHDQGIVHRDIKPENILLDRRGRVKVADFGLAKLVEANGPLTRSADTLSPLDGERAGVRGGPPEALTGAGKIMGTPNYMAPEQRDNPGEVDHRADIYALGVVFYQMLTGELPGKAIEPPSKKVQIDVRLDEVVLRALEKKPELRYQQVSEVKTCVETIVSSGSAVAPAAPADAPATGMAEKAFDEASNAAREARALPAPGGAARYLKPGAQELLHGIKDTLTKEGLVLFARRRLLFVADQALLLFDFTAWVPAFVERERRRRFNFWPFLLLFISTLGFLINGCIPALFLVMRLLHVMPSPHGNPFAFSIQESRELMWMVLSGAGRLVALNLGSSEVAGAGRAQAAKDITRRRASVVFRKLLSMAALMAGGALIGTVVGKLMVAASTAVQASVGGVGWWVLVCVAVGVFMAVGLIFIPIYIRVSREVKRALAERASASSASTFEAWLAIMDGGNYAQSWETAAPSFQRTMSREEWVGRLEKVRRPLGRVLSRKLSSTKHAAFGRHLDAKFATSFDGLPAATETVTLAVQPHGEWKAIGYLIKPAEDSAGQCELRPQQASEVKTCVETNVNSGSAVAPAAPADAPATGIEGKAFEEASNAAREARALPEPGVGSALTKEQAEEIGRDMARLFTKQGLLSFAKRSLLWIANQALLLFDLFATTPPFVERAGRRRFNFWPFLLLFCSNIGFMVNGVILAINLARRLWHPSSPALSDQERLMFEWMLLFAVGRLAALNLGSHDAAGAGHTQAANRISARRVGRVLLTLLGLAALAFGAALSSNWLDKIPVSTITNIARGAPWVVIVIAVGLVLAVGLWLFYLFFRHYTRLHTSVLDVIKEKTEESANAEGLPAVEAWLAITDGGNYAQSWETAAASFRRSISKEEWVGRLEKVRRPLGKVLSRKSQPPQFLAGWTRFGAEFVFATSFDGLPAATETVTFARQRPNGEWKAIGYLIKPEGVGAERSELHPQQAGAPKTQAETIAAMPRASDEPAPTLGSLLRVCRCCVSTPEHLRTFLGRFHNFLAKGELRLNGETLSFDSGWSVVKIPLSSISALAIGAYPSSVITPLKLLTMPGNYLAVTFTEQGVSRTLLFTPTPPLKTFPTWARHHLTDPRTKVWEHMTVLMEWYVALQKAIQARTGSSIQLGQHSVAKTPSKWHRATWFFLGVAFLAILGFRPLLGLLSGVLPGPITTALAAVNSLPGIARVAAGFAISVLDVGLFLFLITWLVNLLIKLDVAVGPLWRRRSIQFANSFPAQPTDEKNWLAIVDSGDYARSWATAADSFQRAISKEEWVARLEKVRWPLGKVISRQLRSVQFPRKLRCLKDAAVGSRLEQKFNTSFDGLPGAVETVTFAAQPNGEWKAIGYLINQRPRFSRAAIVGSCLGILGLLALVLDAAIGDSNLLDEGPSNALAAGWALCLLISTILGWVAVTQIRRSAGRLQGMWLAVFDGLLFPLLALDGLLAFQASAMVQTFSAIDAVLAQLGIQPASNERFEWLAGMATVFICAVANTLIAWSVWRAVNKRSAGVPTAGTEYSSFGKWARGPLIVGTIGPSLVLTILPWQEGWAEGLAAAIGSVALALALVWGLISWRKRLGKFVVIATSALFVALLVGAVALSFVIVPAKRARLQAAFGPVTERTLPMDEDGWTPLFDLDRNQPVPDPKPGDPAVDRVQHLAQLKKPGVAIHHDGQTQVIAVSGMVIHGNDDGQWERITDLEALAGPVGFGFLSADVTVPGAYQTGDFPGKLPLTLFFKTPACKLGLLQITGFTENPRAVKIRYKLVPDVATTPDAAAAVQNLSFGPVKQVAAMTARKGDIGVRLEALGTVESSNSVMFAIPEDYCQEVIRKFNAHQAMTVEAYDARWEKRFGHGLLSGVDNQIDTATGTLKCRASLTPDGENLMVPGLFLNIRLLLEVKHGVTLVPTNAVLYDTQGAFVWAIKLNQTVSRRQVQTGAIDGAKVEIQSGLSPGEIVAGDGFNGLQDGQKIRYKLAQQNDAAKSQLVSSTELLAEPPKLQSDEQIRHKIVGTWTVDGDPSRTIENKPDGRFVTREGTKLLAEGTMQVKDGFIVATMTNGSGPNATVEVESNKVVSIDDSKMVILTSQGGTNVLTAHRK